MPASRRTVYIAGAGIAGLTLALALAKFGTNVVVLERNETLSAFGAGLQISPNAYRVLDALGLGDAIAEQGFRPEGIDVYPQGRSRPLVTLKLGEAIARRFGAPYAVMHRADLADALHQACRKFANIDIVFAVRAFDVANHARGISVSCDRIEGQGRLGQGFAFVGADGVHSATRTKMLGGPTARYAGRIAWRALVPLDAASAIIDPTRTSLLLGPDHHLVAYPLPHRSLVNLALFIRAKADRTEATTPTLPRVRDPRVEKLLTLAADGWTPWPLYTVDTPNWSDGGIGLVGDAAHAMLPFQAQGAAMAIEDAATLAPLLTNAPDAATAFAAFAKARRPRIDRVAAISRSNGRIFHLGWPLSVGRDLVMRAQGSQGHFRRLGWLYGYDATELSGALND